MKTSQANPTHAELVTIFGGSGFVGTQIVQALARAGYRVRVAVRRPNQALESRMFGAVGQVQPVAANVTMPDSIARAVAGADIVINLVGVGYDRGKQTLKAVNVEGARAVAAAAKAAGVSRLVHLSALGADIEAKSAYAKSKGEGEQAVREAFPDAIIVRPSIVFGQGDTFFNRLGFVARLFPIMPVIGGKSRMQPVYVGDVADFVAKAADGDIKPGRSYELGGPEVLTQRQLLELVLAETARSRPLLPLPAGIASLLATPMSMLPNPLLTPDQVILLGQDNVVSEAAAKDKRTLVAAGIAPTPLGAILPNYMWRFRKNGQFDRQTA